MWEALQQKKSLGILFENRAELLENWKPVKHFEFHCVFDCIWDQKKSKDHCYLVSETGRNSRSKLVSFTRISLSSPGKYHSAPHEASIQILFIPLLYQAFEHALNDKQTNVSLLSLIFFIYSSLFLIHICFSSLWSNYMIRLRKTVLTGWEKSFFYRHFLQV